MFVYKASCDNAGEIKSYSFMYYEKKMYIHQSNPSMYSFPYSWFLSIARKDAPLFNDMMNLVNKVYIGLTCSNKDTETIIKDIRKFGFLDFTPDFDVNTEMNRELLNQFWKDCMCLDYFFEDFNTEMIKEIDRNGNIETFHRNKFKGIPTSIEELIRRIITDVNKW